MLYESFAEFTKFAELAAGGKPSTWLPPGGLVEHIFYKFGASPQPNLKHRFKVWNVCSTLNKDNQWYKGNKEVEVTKELKATKDMKVTKELEVTNELGVTKDVKETKGIEETKDNEVTKDIEVTKDWSKIKKICAGVVGVKRGVEGDGRDGGDGGDRLEEEANMTNLNINFSQHPSNGF